MYKQILLTLDGSLLAEQAVPHAIAHADHFEAELILVKVLEPLAKNLSLPHRAVKRAEKATRKIAHEYLERLADDIRNKGISVKAVTISGSPHTEIIQFAERENIDLIVIYSRGQSGLRRWLVGSVADRVARGVSIPVLLVRAQKGEILVD